MISSSSNSAGLLAAVAFSAIVALVFLRTKEAQFGRIMAWRRALRPKELLTENEREFLGRLRRSVPELKVWPQVAMAAMIDCALDRTHPDYWKIRRLYSQKIVDFVVVSREDRDVVCVVELDDRTHDSKKSQDAARDALLAAVGIRTIRFDSRAKPTEKRIRQEILDR